jgi:uncharacterized protein DUF2252
VSIQKATRHFEAWLGERITLVARDLALKHRLMRDSRFAFLRGTFYRWGQIWPDRCPAAAAAPIVVAVGDLHVENFGTWRDTEGRLVWGINDFDEAYPLPYTSDLIRLAASAHLAIAEGHLAIRRRDACEVILTGYAEGLAAGRPFVLGEEHGWLRRLALGELRDPVHFWKKLCGMRPVHRGIPASARKALNRLMPEGGLPCRMVQRQAGVGSLGRQRLVAIAEWRGGLVAREAKAFVPSACTWVRPGSRATANYPALLLERAVRCRDPFVQIQPPWILRRLAPDCSRVELQALPKERDEQRLLHGMGLETANVHLASPAAVRAVRKDLKRRPQGWLRDAVETMVGATTDDWAAWKKG